ncbi:MAG: gliding motility-associated C-terminal domain-containing protein [Flavobacteriaceae bacterium]
MKKIYLVFAVLACCSFKVFSQEIQLFQQFNGRYDYLSFGNTLNEEENGLTSACEILTESSADFQLQAGQQIVAAYLYWAGSGDGDFDVTLNTTPITAQRTFSFVLDATHSYFAAYADVTNQLINEGNTTYTLSNLDLTNVIIDYCGNATNFGGWAVTVIYQDDTLPLNQVNIFYGMEGVSQLNTTLDITLENLNVLDNTGAKIGFLAWEGDSGLAVNETLRVNGNIISNPPLNPSDNAFNGTNSFTNSSVLYNMDIDFYNIENNIQPGDVNAQIQLTSGQDLVMVNNIVTVLNTELPDASISLDDVVYDPFCGNLDIDVDYTVYNLNSTDIVPAGTSVGFYANNTLIQQTQTQNDIPIDGSESGSITLTVPNGVPADILLRAYVDDINALAEINEENNEDNTEIHLLLYPEIVGLHNLELCDVVGEEIFDLTEATSQIDPINSITYHLTEADAQTGDNPIENPESYENPENPQTIWIRVFNPDCFVVDSFQVEVIICPLPDATVTINNDLYACRQRDLLIEYTVNNIGTDTLPAGTAIAFYADTTLIGQSTTQNDIPIGGSEPGLLEVDLPESIPNQFTLLAVVDDDGTGLGTIQELNEFNNEFEITVTFGSLPAIPELPNLIECDTGFQKATFNLFDEDLLAAITTNTQGEIQFFTSLAEATVNLNPIQNPGEYENTSNPQTIYVRLENEICFTTSSFQLIVEKCPPMIPDGISPNGDGLNDVFKIFYIVDVFPNFELKVFSREGNLIYEGGNDEGLWNAIPNRGILQQNKVVPVGTYFYVLVLNDPNYPEPFIGDVYVNY